MIFDRTLEDVENAKLLREKMQSGDKLSDEEVEAFERGACTITMLNRVERKQAELSELLNSLYYRNGITNKEHYLTEILSHEDYLRILDNVRVLKEAFYSYPTTPEAPNYMYGYLEANAIEKILFDIQAIIDSIKDTFRKCGTFKCGEVI